MKKIICKNCDTAFIGHYCSNCGQQADTQQLNLRYLWDEIKHNLFHIDSGLLYSIQQLYIRPGHSIREFVEGKRVKHLQPFSLLILLASAYGFLLLYFDIDVVSSQGPGGSEERTQNLYRFADWLTKHISLVNVLTIPLYALGSFFAFRTQAYNFVEHLVLNAFLACQRLCLIILLFPLMYNLSGTSNFSDYTLLITILQFILMVWTYIQFFEALKAWKACLLSLLSYLIYWIGFAVFIAILGEVFNLL